MKKLFIVFLFLTTSYVTAQKEANFWYFGRNAGIDFSSGSPVVINDGQLNTDEGCSSISDKNGNLLFYSDGISVYTKNHELMKYSDGRLANDLRGNPSSTQSGLIVPNPEDENLYYIFSVGTDYVGGGSGLPSNPGFNYYTVDITKGNGGEIIEGPVNLSNGRDTEWSEKVTAVQADNCKEIWILSLVQNSFYAYKVDKNGVNISPVISSTSSFLNDKRGYMKVSPDGKKIAVADYNAGFNSQTNSFDLGNSKLTLFDFNSTTGSVSNPLSGLITPQSDGAPYGIEFSQQSTKLYTATHDGTSSKIYQFDITEQDITSTKALINQKTGYRGALQLATDGKIYATVPVSYQQGTGFLDVIDNADAQASNVTYTSDAVQLNGTSTQGLPPFIQSFFAPVNLVNVDTGIILNNTNQVFCIGESYTIEPEKNEPTDTYTWFKDGTEIATTRTLTIDNTNFGSGLYEVKIEDTSECKKTFTGKVQINFEPKPTINVIAPYIQCDFDANPIDGFTTFNLESKENELVNDTTNLNFEFFEVTDINFTSPINKSNYTNIVATNHSIVVRATNTVTNCYQTGILELQVNPTGLTNYSDEYVCELDNNASNSDAKFSEGSNNSFYNFDLKTQQIISESGNSLTLATHNFQYYRTAEDASLQNNEIIPPYEDDLFTNNSDVFVRISSKGTSSCETVGNFKIFVEELPTPQGDLSEKILCVDNPRGNPQTHFTELNANTGNSSDTYKWYLNGNEISGANNAIYQATSAGEYKVEAYRDYPNITEDCMGYNTFFVKESNVASVINIKTSDDQDNPDNNKIEITVEGIGDYEYAINSSNVADFKKGTKNLTYTFTNISPGLNKIYIRDSNECGIVSTQEISVIYFQRHFSPNEDGHLDTWNVLGVNNDFFDVVKINVFNRYGKLIYKTTDKNSPGWDGYFNGSLLPKNDYWYNAELIDKTGKVRKKIGHFSLIK